MRNKGLQCPLRIRVEKDDYKQLEQVVEQEEINISILMRKFIRDGLKNADKQIRNNKILDLSDIVKVKGFHSPVMILVTKSVRERLQQICKQKNTTYSVLLRKFIKQGLANYIVKESNSEVVNNE